LKKLKLIKRNNTSKDITYITNLDSGKSKKSSETNLKSES
jgi:hypothetical protein